MDTWTWVLLGVVLYWLLLTLLRQSGLLPNSVGTMGPLVTLHTQRGRDLLNWLARPKRTWRAWGNFGLGAALVVMAGAFLTLLATGVGVVLNPPEATAITQPRNVLVIPGVNDFLPWAVAPEILVGLLVGIVVHEGGHGVMCRVEDIDVESMGVVLLTVLPVGAFVEPDEESQRRADRGSRARMFAAGVTNNFLLTAVAFGLLFGPVAGAISVAPGAHVGDVHPGSPAARAGIEKGDTIVGFAGRNVTSNQDLRQTVLNVSDRTVQVRLASGETVSVNRSLFVTGAVREDTPLSQLAVNDTIVAVNGTEVHTEAAFRDAVRNRTVASVTTASGTTVTAPMGALVVVVPDSPLARSTPLDGNDHVVVTRIGGTRVLDAGDVTAALNGTAAGETVTLEAYVNGTRHTYTATLGNRQGDPGGFLGVQVYPGISGMSVTDLGVQLYPADSFLAVLSGAAAGGFAQSIYTVLLLPFVGVVYPELFGYNFAGFVDWNAGFYEVTGPLGGLDGVVFALANVLFWAGWVNLNLGFFNCIPGYPLDGGHLLRTCSESVVSRLPVGDKRSAVRSVTTSVGLLMLGSLLLMVFGPRLLN